MTVSSAGKWGRRMGRQQIDYLTRREQQERDAMARAKDAAIADLHRQMAEHFAELVREARDDDDSDGARYGTTLPVEREHRA
ncbi:MAG: hypothetical protein ACRYG4_14295 [Janthinobacterium lividum]